MEFGDFDLVMVLFVDSGVGSGIISSNLTFGC